MNRDGVDGNFEERFKRLTRAAGAGSDSELARLLGITHQSVSSARKRGSFPLNWVTRVVERTGASADWILYGDKAGGGRGTEWGPAGSDHERARDTRDEQAPFGVRQFYNAGELVSPPHVEPRLAEGSGLLESSNGSSPVAFRHHFLSRLGAVHRMVTLSMPGDNMRPTIQRGDVLLCDLSQTEIMPGNIYLLAVSGSVTVRRVDHAPGVLRLLSDNSVHPPVEVKLPFDRDSGVLVLGRVIWHATAHG